MAGIGFELQRALRGKSIFKALTVAVTGVIIVAGPWLISIMGISMLTSIASFALKEAQDLFIAVVVYGYAFSILLFGGPHYIFTRYVSDLIYRGKFHRTTAALIAMSIATIAVSVLAASAFALALTSPALSRPGLFRLAVILFFASISVIWVEMLLVTILKGFLTIIGAYLAGMLVSVGAAAWLGGAMGLGGALLGFAFGQLFVAIALAVVLLRWNFPTPPLREVRPLLSYARRYAALMASGWLYSGGLWIDKIVYWFGNGASVRDTFVHLYPTYDYAAYIANLSAIPVLVFFTIFTETTFFAGLRRLLIKLGTSTYARIVEEKYNFRRSAGRIISRQFSFHAVIVLALFLGLGDALTKILVTGVFFHIAFLTFFTFLFYVESYGTALKGAAVFFGVNLLGTLATVLVPALPLGSGYLAAGSLAALYAGTRLYRDIGDLDRIVFSRKYEA